MNRQNVSRGKRDRSFDRRLDQLIETGRQVVDGVAGNGPGQRNLKYVDRNFSSNSSFNTVGRWVEDKLEWLLEDDEDWMEESLDLNSQRNDFRSKRPLEAISRRISRQEDNNLYDQEINVEISKDEWPEESTFKLDQWKRVELNQQDAEQIGNKESSQRSISRRPLPRSSRRRL